MSNIEEHNQEFAPVTEYIPHRELSTQPDTDAKRLYAVGCFVVAVSLNAEIVSELLIQTAGHNRITEAAGVTLAAAGYVGLRFGGYCIDLIHSETDQIVG